MSPARQGCFHGEGAIAVFSCNDKAATGIYIHYISGMDLEKVL